MKHFACPDDVYSGFSRSNFSRARGKHPYPFLDPASQASPRTWREIHEWGSL